MFVSRFADEAVVARLAEVQRRYDDGTDSYEAFGIPPKLTGHGAHESNDNPRRRHPLPGVQSK